jgi:hypothetical protein
MKPRSTALNRAKSVSFRSDTSLVPLCVGVALAACASSSGGPAVLGDCKGGPDASCATSTSGGGGSSGGGSDSGSTSEDGGEVADSGTCGTAGGLLNTSNSQCQPCIETNCCLAAGACTGQCLSLVTCPSSAIASCETTYPQGIAAYNDLGACIARSCPTQCPVLPVATAGDI